MCAIALEYNRRAATMSPNFVAIQAILDTDNIRTPMCPVLRLSRSDCSKHRLALLNIPRCSKQDPRLLITASLSALESMQAA